MPTLTLVTKAFRLIKEYLAIRRDPVQFARSIGVRIGDRCRLIGINRGTFGSEPYLISIGDHVTITHGVKFITHDGGVWVFRDNHPDIDVVLPISIGNNVFIGMNTIILPGVIIGDNCVIGAGSVVTRLIPSNCVAAGVPARILKTLHEYEAQVQKKALYVRSLPDAKKRLLYERVAKNYLSKLNDGVVKQYTETDA